MQNFRKGTVPGETVTIRGKINIWKIKPFQRQAIILQCYTTLKWSEMKNYLIEIKNYAIDNKCFCLNLINVKKRNATNCSIQQKKGSIKILAIWNMTNEIVLSLKHRKESETEFNWA